ncbi:MoxR family ATPase [Thermoactinomyces sp. CICC 10521]|uniref:MoxR family ATPase n=2 Tax=Thermoactinomycetaceae TaxID=186824 RepID=A0A7W1XC07_9BACL|nr:MULTISPECIES: MoxR family ATPase [unclassified Thermoactinomyces]MBA4543876.1 MoxR family ATPase [Thermoactinomyces daqus]MBH8599384.1 MoxR family ATPase [Thermoactinomyces sp. CICC 10523]MBH8605166.1 MoxR family ATPase [Thermoactinomyces sp. CICC 10522]MBH8608294.1 MoxR family ATPase [Thermoactinomyces sp. CICC 10521]
MQAINQVVLGQEENIRFLWASFLVGGHVLLEGVPGLGKTLLVRTLARIVDCSCSRLQFTSDLMPSDVTGTKVYDMQSGKFTFRKGPIFADILIADEINRTPPKTQSALLEAMEEKQITIDGETYTLSPLFFVAATQNPIEYEGTYSLPEAQLDRFAVKLVVDYPEEKEEEQLLAGHRIGGREEITLKPIVGMEEILAIRNDLEQISVDPSVVQYLLQMLRATRRHPKVMLGASPRAGLAILSLSKAEAAMSGRTFVTPDDVKRLIKPALRHRILLYPEGELEGWKADDVLAEIMEASMVPR